MPEDKVETPGCVDSWNDGWEAQYNAAIWGTAESGMYPCVDEQDTDATPCASRPVTDGKSRDNSTELSDSPSRCECYGDDEVFDLLATLREEEIERLKNFARFRLIGKSARPGYIEVDDLFSDALIGTMQETRKWKRGISPFNQLFAVMRSIRHQRQKQAGRFVPLNEAMPLSQDWRVSALDAQKSVAQLREKLRGDAIALAILDCMMEDTRPRHARFTLGNSAKVYRAARKRIRRVAEKLPGAPCFKRKG